MTLLVPTLGGFAALVLWVVRPRAALLFLLYLQLGLTVGTEQLTLAELLYSGAFAGVVIGWIFQLALRGWRLPKGSMNLPTALLLLAITMSTVLACLKGLPLSVSLRAMAKYYSLGLVFLIPWAYKSKDQLKELGIHFVIVAALMVIRDLSSLATYGPQQLGGVKHQSIYFLLAIPLLFVSLLHKRPLRQKVSSSLVMGAFIIRALASGVRSYCLTAIVMIMLMLKLGRQSYRILFLGGVATVAIFLILENVYPPVNVLMQRTQQRFVTLLKFPITSKANVSVWIRLLELEGAWRAAWKSPFFGHGAGAAYSLRNPITGEYYTKTYAHMVPLDIFLSFGFFGLGCWVFWFKRMLGQLRRMAHREHELYWRRVMWALYVNGISLIILSLVNRVVLAPPSLFYLALVGGVVLTLERIHLAERKTER